VKKDFDPFFLELPDDGQRIHCVSGKPANGFCDD
jgi:hypothetical protein